MLPAGGRFEAAVYGCLSGHVSAMLPVCSSWEDVAWAWSRVWMEVRAEQALGMEKQKAAHMVRGEGGPSERLQVDKLEDRAGRLSFQRFECPQACFPCGDSLLECLLIMMVM